MSLQYLILVLGRPQTVGELLALLLQPVHIASCMCSVLVVLILLLFLQQAQLCNLALQTQKVEHSRLRTSRNAACDTDGGVD